MCGISNCSRYDQFCVNIEICYCQVHIKKKHTQTKPLKVVIRKRQPKKKGPDLTVSHHTALEESNVIAPHIKSSQVLYCSIKICVL